MFRTTYRRSFNRITLAIAATLAACTDGPTSPRAADPMLGGGAAAALGPKPASGVLVFQSAALGVGEIYGR